MELNTISGDKEIDRIIDAAFKQVASDEQAVSFDSVNAAIGEQLNGFNEECYDAFIRFYEGEYVRTEAQLKAEREPVEEVDFTVPVTVVEPEPVVEEVVETPPEFSRETVLQAIQDATSDLHQARSDIQKFSRLVQEARNAVAVAVNAWQRGTAAPKTREELVRQEIAAQRRYKELVASGEIPSRQRPTIAGNLRAGFYPRDESAAGFARGNNFPVQVFDGAGNSTAVTPVKGNRRGAMPLIQLQAKMVRELGHALPVQGQSKNGLIPEKTPAPSNEAALKAAAMGKGARK
jgi:hypothetical protein